MIEALASLGVQIDSVGAQAFKVHGCSGVFGQLNSDTSIYLGNSGTSSRFLLSVVSLLPAGCSCVFEADDRLSSRPMAGLISLLEGLGLIEVEYLQTKNRYAYCMSMTVVDRTGLLVYRYPFRVTSTGSAKSVDRFTIDVSETSQFASSLLL